MLPETPQPTPMSVPTPAPAPTQSLVPSPMPTQQPKHTITPGKFHFLLKKKWTKVKFCVQ